MFGVDGGKGNGMKNEPSSQGSQSSFVSVPGPVVELFVPRLHLQECLLWDVEML